MNEDGPIHIDSGGKKAGISRHEKIGTEHLTLHWKELNVASIQNSHDN